MAALLKNALRVCSDERFLLVAFGVASVGIASLVTELLVIVRETNEVSVPPPKTQYITQDTEDSLAADTLNKLLLHSNYAVQEVAGRILYDRVVNDPKIVQYLLYQITRPAYETRLKGLRALYLLMTEATDGVPKLNNWKAYAALVRSFELALGDQERELLDNPLWDDYGLRDIAERFCVNLALQLCNRYGAEKLVKAKFVEKWLAKQAWGITDEERLKNFDAYRRRDSNKIMALIKRVTDCAEGRSALVKCNLMLPSSPPLAALPSGSDPQLNPNFDVDDFLSENDGPAGYVVEAEPRNWEHSVEEQRLRRQHREAMVLNDGTRPIGRDDIIERNDG